MLIQPVSCVWITRMVETETGVFGSYRVRRTDQASIIKYRKEQ